MLNFEKMKTQQSKTAKHILPIILQAADHYQDANILKEANKIKDCGHYIQARFCANDAEAYFKSYSRCKSKYCLTCNKLKQYIWLAKIFPVVNSWIASNKIINFGTFTLYNTDILYDQLAVINKAWRIFSNNDKNTAKEFKSHFCGGLKSLEIKLGKNSHKWHSHLHCLMFKEIKENDFDWLKDNWNHAVALAMKQLYPYIKEEIEENYKLRLKEYNAGIRKKKPQLKYGSVDIKNITNASTKEEQMHMILECTKYITKMEQYLTLEKFGEIFYTIKGKRQIATWGMLNGLDKAVDSEFEESTEHEIIQFTCKTCGCHESQLIALSRYELIQLKLIDNSEASSEDKISAKLAFVNVRKNNKDMYKKNQSTFEPIPEDVIYNINKIEINMMDDKDVTTYQSESFQIPSSINDIDDE